MSVLVRKYGGTSLANFHRIGLMADRLARARERQDKVVAVVSTVGDALLHEGRRSLRLWNAGGAVVAAPGRGAELPGGQCLPELVAAGEQVASALLALALRAAGVPVVVFAGGSRAIGVPDGTLQAGWFRLVGDGDLEPEEVAQELDRGRVVIVSGLLALGSYCDANTLARGGSDAVAVALAAALGAPQCEICTDVAGLYTADPQVVRNARKLSAISCEEMMELAYLGARVVPARAVEMAMQLGVAIHLRSAFHDEEGTWIKGVPDMKNQKPVVGVAHDPHVARITVLAVPDRPGVAHAIFGALGEAGINVDMIVQSTRHEEFTDVLFTVDRSDLERAMEVTRGVAERLGAEGCVYDDQVAKVSIVGAGMTTYPGVAAKMFGALARNGINIQVIATSEIKVSCLIDAADLERAVAAVHDEFELAL